MEHALPPFSLRRFDMGALTVVTPATTAPVTIPEAAEFLRVTDERDLDNVGRLITAATELWEEKTGRQLVTASLRETFDCFPPWTDRNRRQSFKVRRSPLASVTAVKHLDNTGTEQTVATTVYTVDTVNEPGRISLADGQSWPSIDNVDNAVWIEYDAGYGAASAVPETVRLGIMHLVNWWFNHRELASAPTSFFELPMHMRALVMNNRIRGIA